MICYGNVLLLINENGYFFMPIIENVFSTKIEKRYLVTDTTEALRIMLSELTPFIDKIIVLIT